MWYVDLQAAHKFFEKQARGLHYYMYHEVVEDVPEFTFVAPLEQLSDEHRSLFEVYTVGGFSGWSEVGTRGFISEVGKSDYPKQLEPQLTGIWDVIQQNHCRISICQSSVRFVISEYLAAEVQW